MQPVHDYGDRGGALDTGAIPLVKYVSSGPSMAYSNGRAIGYGYSEIGVAPAVLTSNATPASATPVLGNQFMMKSLTARVNAPGALTRYGKRMLASAGNAAVASMACGLWMDPAARSHVGWRVCIGLVACEVNLVTALYWLGGLQPDGALPRARLRLTRNWLTRAITWVAAAAMLAVIIAAFASAVPAW